MKRENNEALRSGVSLLHLHKSGRDGALRSMLHLRLSPSPPPHPLWAGEVLFPECTLPGQLHNALARSPGHCRDSLFLQAHTVGQFRIPIHLTCMFFGGNLEKINKQINYFTTSCSPQVRTSRAWRCTTTGSTWWEDIPFGPMSLWRVFR